MNLRRLNILVVSSGLLMAGCATGGSFGSRPLNSAGSLSPEEVRLQSVEDKVAKIDQRLDAMGSNNTDQQLITMRDDMRSLRGDIEQLQNQIKTSQQANKSLYANLDQRLQQLETGGAGATTGPTSTPGTLSAAAVGGPQATVASPEEEKAYLATFDLLKSGKYDDAVKGFRGMLDRWPQGRYADNAWYWMGEANYVRRDYAAALASFQSVVDRFPQSPKMADALLKVGYCQIELKKTADAKQTLQKVVNEYPNSNAANLARQRLLQLG